MPKNRSGPKNSIKRGKKPSKYFDDADFDDYDDYENDDNYGEFELSDEEETSGDSNKKRTKLRPKDKHRARREKRSRHRYHDHEIPSSHDYPLPPPPPPPHYPHPYPTIPRKPSRKPGIAGALLIVTAILGIITAISAAFLGSMLTDFENNKEIFGLDENIDISGEITLDDGTPVENVTISIVGVNIHNETDIEGKYQLDEVPTGNQKIRVEKEGYDTIIYKTFIAPPGDMFNWWDVDSDDNKQADNYDFTLTPGNEVVTKGSYPPFDLIGNILYACTVLVLVFSIIALIGSYYALKRKNFPIAMMGAIFGIFSFGLFIGTVLAIIALFLLILGRDEFKRNMEIKKPY